MDDVRITDLREVAESMASDGLATMGDMRNGSFNGYNSEYADGGGSYIDHILAKPNSKLAVDFYGVLYDQIGVEGKEISVPTGYISCLLYTSGIPVVADITIRQLQFEAMRLLVLPGGYPGYENLEKSAAVKSLLRRAAEAGKEIAAICGAPSVLGKLGLLAGRSATCYPGMEQLLNCSVLTRCV